MDKNNNFSTDGASIKPVSSLLSHFEGMKTHPKPLREESRSRDITDTNSSLEAPRSTVPVRASLDLPRSSSPWNVKPEAGQTIPRTPGDPQKRRSSPTKSNHKRPMSMHIGSSPQLTPAVRVESPRSPPQTYFQRSISRSPERVDNTPFGKVRELISQHSSRATTPGSGTGSDGDVFFSRGNSKDNVIPASSPSVARSASPNKQQPPPVNRAEKPKIPAKPLNIVQPAAGRLTPEPRRPSMDVKNSPFSTPPSSNENSPANSPPIEVSPFSPAEPLSSPDSAQTPTAPEFANTGSAVHGRHQTVSTSVSHTPHYNDPRHMGFAPGSGITERVDPRLVGFSSTTARSAPAEHTVVPARANTVIERPAARDPRAFGFSVAKPAQRAVSETIRQTPPSTTHYAQQSTPSRTSQPRDPRHFGFSSIATSVMETDEAARPDLPARRPANEPPPRPSDDSKPGARQPVRQATTSNAERPQPASAPSQRAIVAQLPDGHFPPPPKRRTFNDEDDLAKTPTIPPLSRASTLAPESRQVQHDNDSDEAERGHEPSTIRTDYPDATQTNRRPPFGLSGHYEIQTRSDGRTFDVCGKYLCVAGYITRIFDMSTGEQIVGLNHGETVKITAARFKPGMGPDDEGQRLWLGNNVGELQEIDIADHTVVGSTTVHNRREIITILRHRRNLWSLDEEGKLFVWRADESGAPNMKYSPISHKVQRGHTFSMVAQDKLWLATGKELRIHRPGNDAHFNVLSRPLVQSGTGDITSGAYTSWKGGRIYLGHTDGKVTIYSTSDYSCHSIVKISDYKINELAFVGDKLWAAYKTGMVYVYDVSVSPWRVKKDWRAHEGPAHRMILDPSSVWTMQRLQVVTAGHDNYVRMWDATLEEDWMDNAMQERDVEYCSFRELRAAVITWNVGAISPAIMRNDFIADAIDSTNPPDIIVFGFQEVVDLEDRAVTAKSLLGFAKKKDTSKTEQHQSRVYREWRDYLTRCIGRFTDAQTSYSELSTSSLVGLFQCIFVRQEERRNTSMLSNTSVKCGMGGHYGNKGALVTRFVLDDCSLCFVNCHLAAGQTHTSHRNNDVATILESESLTVEPNRQVRSSLFVGGGDGTQILDHEICILNGDLNYRIDAIPRDTVVKMIRNNELAKLMERDQLMVSRRRVSGFRLAPFVELPITFAPTYKYDVNTDNYDSSEKKRAPAWCDRLLYRGQGRVKQLDYRRHEVRVSDHRPVSGMFKLRIKKVHPAQRERVREECHREFKGVKKEMAESVCVRWLVDVMGISEGEARTLVIG